MTVAATSLGVVLVTLMKGILYRDDTPSLWDALLVLQTRVRDYVSTLGLELILDDTEGYAFLRQRPSTEPVADEPAPADLPRLVARRPLGFGVSLLLALLRKHLVEADAKTGDTRVILSREDIVEQMRLFMPDATNEAKASDRVDGHIGKAVELGFLRPLQGHTDQYEIRRILKAFVDAQWLHTFGERLAEYQTHADKRD